MLRAVALALAVAAGCAQAQPVCLPRSASLPVDRTGGELMQGTVPGIRGEWYALWCPTGTFNGTTETWSLHTYAVLDKYRVGAPAVLAAVRSALAASDPVATVAASLRAGEFVPPAGTQDRYDWESLLYAACQQAAAVGYGATPRPVTLARGCVPPTPLPATATETWRVTPSGSTLFSASGGRLTAPIAGRRAPGGATCDSSKPAIRVGSSTYYPLQGGAPGEYAACQRVN